MRLIGSNEITIAGITLYNGLEHPLRHRYLETLRVKLPEPVLPQELHPHIDLGIIRRCYTVPAFLPDAWLTEQVKGWGEEPVEPHPTDHVLLDVTANLDTTLTVAGRQLNLKPVYMGGKSLSYDGTVSIELLTP